MIEKHLIIELKHGNKEAFSLLFRQYYKDLVLYGGYFLRDKVHCEDIVQSIFMKLWANREKLEIETSLKSFLLKSVRNACLDELRHESIVNEHEAYVLSSDDTLNPNSLDTEDYILYSDLHDHLMDALNKLPENCKEAFVMNRFDGLKYKEIALKLGVSERTVEVRIGKALEQLRKLLKAFFVLVLFFLFAQIG